MTYPDWEKMYAVLCGEVSEALDVLPLFPENIPAYEILENALLKTENMYCDRNFKGRLPKEPEALRQRLREAFQEMLPEEQAEALAEEMLPGFLREEAEDGELSV